MRPRTGAGSEGAIVGAAAGVGGGGHRGTARVRRGGRVDPAGRRGDGGDHFSRESDESRGLRAGDTCRAGTGTAGGRAARRGGLLVSPKMFQGMERDLSIVAFSTFLEGLGEGLFIFFLPLALQRWNADAVQIGVVLSMIGVTMAVVQVPAGYFSDRFGTRPIIFASLLLGIASAIVMAAANSLPFFVAGLLAYACTSFCSAPMNSYVTSLR